MKLWLLTACAFISVSSLPAQQSLQLVWGDEFNGPAGSQPDPAKWKYDLGNHNGWGNRELENYTNDAENAHMDGNGNLVIRAIPMRLQPWLMSVSCVWKQRLQIPGAVLAIHLGDILRQHQRERKGREKRFAEAQ
jgi:hypothetical protein